MAVKVTKKVKYTMALYHKINVTKSTFYMESFMLFSKSAQLLDYAALKNLENKYSENSYNRVINYPIGMHT